MRLIYSLIMWYRASVRHRHDPRYWCATSLRCRSKSMLHDITWSYCGFQELFSLMPSALSFIFLGQHTHTHLIRWKDFKCRNLDTHPRSSNHQAALRRRDTQHTSFNFECQVCLMGGAWRPGIVKIGSFLLAQCAFLHLAFCSRSLGGHCAIFLENCAVLCIKQECSKTKQCCLQNRRLKLNVQKQNFLLEMTQMAFMLKYV